MTTGPAGRLRASRTPGTARPLGARWTARASCGAASRGERCGQPFLEPEHLRPRPERPPERGDHGRALEPAAARRRGDEVAEAVRDVEVDGVAPRRLSGADSRRGVDQGREPAAARPELTEADSPTSRRRSSLYSREQAVERHVDEVRVAVERVAVGERELRALDDRVDVLGRADAEGREVEPGEQGELLQQDRPLPPRPGLADRVAVVVVGDRRLDRRLSPRDRRRRADRRSPR